MQVGMFFVQIPQGRELHSGHIELKHDTRYTVRLGSLDYNRRCDATVEIDGKEIGAFRLNAGQTITLERPQHDTGCFTFYRSDSAEAGVAGVGDVARDQRGLVRVTFRPENRVYNVYTATRSRGYGAGGQSYNAEEKTAGGITGLSGTSRQQFTEVANLDYDPAGEVVITLRLVCVEDRPAARPLTAAPRGNPVPAPVE